MKSHVRTAALAGAAVFVALALGRPAAAQDALAMTVLNEGKVPTEPVRVSAVTDGEKRPVAETGEDGRVTLPFDLLNLGKGTRVSVRLATCEGETEVVLVPEGETDDTCEAEGDGCGCEELGVIAWGETASITIDVAPTGATMAVGDGPAPSADPGAAPAGDGGAPRVRFGLDVGAAYWPNMEDAVCAQAGIGSCETDESSLILNPYVEVRPSTLPVYLGVGGFFSSLSYTQELGDPSAPARAVGDLDATGVDLFLRALLASQRPLNPWIMLGTTRMWNRVKIDVDFDGEISTVERDESGFRLLGGAGLDWNLTGSLWGRLSLEYRGGGGDDADRDVSATAGFGFGF